jgi:hypothetical protein
VTMQIFDLEQEVQLIELLHVRIVAQYLPALLDMRILAQLAAAARHENSRSITRR